MLLVAPIPGWYLKNRTMDHPQRKTSFSGPDARTFSKAEFLANGKAVVEHAAATGTAVVAGADGKPVLVISIPTEDLPVLDG